MKHSLIFTILFCLLFAGCKKQSVVNVPPVTTGTNDTLPEHTPCHAIYYWKNTFELSEYEKTFLSTHDIKRMYVRFFDVTVDNNCSGDCPIAVPSATICFRDSVPENTQIVPTVFITVEAMKVIKDQNQGDYIAKEMYRRIKNMCSYNNIGAFSEIQLDCDWTTSTQEAFFQFCKSMRKLCHEDSRLLSSTIRLHQLRGECPPVDYGALMIYNTNNLRDLKVANSIISAKDVKSYLKKVNFKLPLDIAYPSFKWNLSFRNGEFCGIVYSDSVAGALRRRGYTIRYEEARPKEIEQVQELIHERLKQAREKHSVILYHLDEENLKQYTDEDIKNIFTD